MATLNSSASVIPSMIDTGIKVRTQMSRHLALSTLDFTVATTSGVTTITADGKAPTINLANGIITYGGQTHHPSAWKTLMKTIWGISV